MTRTSSCAVVVRRLLSAARNALPQFQRIHTGPIDHVALAELVTSHCDESKFPLEVITVYANDSAWRILTPDAARALIAGAPGASRDNTMTEPDDQEKRPPTRATKGQFKRFAEAALKVGLLVSRRDYDRYFRKTIQPKSEDE
jgi:hypothetical protein